MPKSLYMLLDCDKVKHVHGLLLFCSGKIESVYVFSIGRELGMIQHMYNFTLSQLDCTMVTVIYGF